MALAGRGRRRGSAEEERSMGVSVCGSGSGSSKAAISDARRDCRSASPTLDTSLQSDGELGKGVWGHCSSDCVTPIQKVSRKVEDLPPSFLPLVCTPFYYWRTQDSAHTQGYRFRGRVEEGIPSYSSSLVTNKDRNENPRRPVPPLHPAPVHKTGLDHPTFPSPEAVTKATIRDETGGRGRKSKGVTRGRC